VGLGGGAAGPADLPTAAVTHDRRDVGRPDIRGSEGWLTAGVLALVAQPGG
jgi:hypothetical protein